MTGAATRPTVVRLGTRALVVLTLINMFNYIDRWMVPPLFESLRREPALGHPSDARLGSLMTAFVVVYTLTSPVFGALGDRLSRTRLIAFGVALWSLATATAGLAGSFAMLFLARATVGVGEAAYGTIAPAILADYFPPTRRGRVMAVFACAIPIGSALGYVIGGLVDTHYGWRTAFFVAGGPGLLLALLTLAVADPPRGSQDTAPAGPDGQGPASVRRAYEALARNATYVLTCAGYAAYTFALGGIAAWLPSFFERVRGVPHDQAAWLPGAIVVVTGFVGTFAGGWLADRLLARNRQAYWWLSGLATLAAAPVVLIVFTAASPAIFWPATAVAEVLLFASTAPINAATLNIVPPTMRATALATQILIIHLFGDVPSPWLIGVISDASSLATAVLIMPVAVLASGLLWMQTARRARRDAAG
ncbi:MAG TPA: MFS transporter [Vicinamibacterales bacterium]|nr:MFS transporter [Vicinamibacterales bacterium]